MSPDNTFSFHAYEGMRTVEQLRQSYIFVPAKVAAQQNLRSQSHQTVSVTQSLGW